jgi:hypothetical protein
MEGFQIMRADPGDRAVYGVGLHALAYWDRGFESRRDMDVRLLCLLCAV